MLNDWTYYLPSNGSLSNIPQIAQATTQLDSTIETGGLPGSTLFGQITNVVNIGQASGGNNYVTLNGKDGQITVSDGTNVRVLIGRFST